MTGPLLGIQGLGTETMLSPKRISLLLRVRVCARARVFQGKSLGEGFKLRKRGTKMIQKRK